MTDAAPDYLVLAVLAHPDDAELWAGGTLAVHAARGRVAVATAAHGEPRDSEAAAGAALLSADLHLLNAITPEAVGGLLEVVRADVLITHSVHDVHPDHRRVADAVLAALPHAVITTGRPRRVYTCDTYNSLTLTGSVTGAALIDITSTWTVKHAALSAHQSQPIDDHFGPMADVLSRLWGARAGVDRAEAFDPVPILGRRSATPFL